MGIGNQGLDQVFSGTISRARLKKLRLGRQVRDISDDLKKAWVSHQKLSQQCRKRVVREKPVTIGAVVRTMHETGRPFASIAPSIARNLDTDVPGIMSVIATIVGFRLSADNAGTPMPPKRPLVAAIVLRNALRFISLHLSRAWRIRRGHPFSNSSAYRSAHAAKPGRPKSIEFDDKKVAESGRVKAD